MGFDISFKTKKSNKKDYSSFEQSYANFFKTKVNAIKFSSIDKIRHLSELPKLDECHFIMTTSNINSFEILDAINKIHKIKKIYASFNVINNIGIDYIKKYNVECIIMHSHDGKKQFQDLEDNNKKISNNVKKYIQHTKIILCECENDTYISINSSTNPSISSRNESYIIYNSKEYFDNIKDYFENQELKQKISSLLPSKDEVVSFISKQNKTPFDVIKQIPKQKIKEFSLLQFTDGLTALNEIELYFNNTNTVMNAFIASRIKQMNRVTFDKIKSMGMNIFANNATHCKMFFIDSVENKYIIVSTSNFFQQKKYELTEIFNDVYLYNNIMDFCRTFFK